MVLSYMDTELRLILEAIIFGTRPNTEQVPDENEHDEFHANALATLETEGGLVQ